MSKRLLLAIALGLSILSLLVSSALTPAASVGLQDGQSRRDLYEHFLSNHKTDQQAAYEAALEYLRRFPTDGSADVEFMRKWVAAYEKVTGVSREETEAKVSENANLVAYIRKALEESASYRLEQKIDKSDWTIVKNCVRNCATKTELHNVKLVSLVGCTMELQIDRQVFFISGITRAELEQGVGGASKYHVRHTIPLKAINAKGLVPATQTGEFYTVEIRTINNVDLIGRDGSLTQENIRIENDMVVKKKVTPYQKNMSFITSPFFDSYEKASTFANAFKRAIRECQAQ